MKRIVIIVAIAAILPILFLSAVYNPRDFLIAKSIPHYPNATSYRIWANGSWPVGNANGNIEYFTSDKPEVVVTYYKTSLPLKGWKATGSHLSVDEKPNGLDNQIENFSKAILGTQYDLHIDVVPFRKDPYRVTITIERME